MQDCWGEFWALELPYPRPPLSANDRMHWAQRNKLTGQVRADIGHLVAQAKVPRQRKIIAMLVYEPGDGRRADSDNLYPTLKAAVDGLVSVGVVADDDARRVVPFAFRAPYARPEARLRLFVSPLSKEGLQRVLDMIDRMYGGLAE